jgi:hypothetical protein
MSSLFVRRLFVWAISTVIGFILTVAIITFFLPAVSPDPNAAAVSIATYGRGYFIVTLVPFVLLFATILDGFMDTRIWPD